jgi:hypothetical protein
MVPFGERLLMACANNLYDQMFINATAGLVGAGCHADAIGGSRKRRALDPRRL